MILSLSNVFSEHSMFLEIIVFFLLEKINYIRIFY